MRTVPVDPVAQGRLRVLRVYHSGVVAGWRQRDRELRRRGAELRLVSPHRWNEGGGDVKLDVGADDFVVRARTVGRHQFLFLYDPRPLRRLLRETEFDVLDVHEEPASLATAELRILRRLYRPSARLMLYSAENRYKRYPPPFRWLERRALADAAGVYACTEEVVPILRQKGFRGIIRVIGLGVEVDRFSPDGARTPSSGRLNVGYVGRLERHKGVGILLEAVSEEPAMTLDIVGDGPQRRHLEARADALGLGTRARFRGFAPHDTLRASYRSFDAIAIPSLPSQGPTEQFCRVAVEAMASGLPVVVSATGSLPTVVGDGGIVVPPGDPVALRRALRSLADDPVRRAELGEGARVRAARFSWAAIADAHADLYREVVA